MKTLTLYLYAIDPTHVGAGGYRLGRVDQTIVREAGTRLPILPGSSLNGVLRSAALYSLEDEGQREKAMEYARETLYNPNAPRSHGGAKDPVARLFGYAEGNEQGSSRIGALAFRDAQILAYPVATVAGPRWITTAARLTEWGQTGTPMPDTVEQILVPDRGQQPERLNLGSLLFGTRQVSLEGIPNADQTKELAPVLEEIADRLVIVHDDIFPALVNGSLETRTSVSIDFETGAAADGKLFSYEATPRGTLFATTIGVDSSRYPELEQAAHETLKRALTLACATGVGAMTTRGFGRMQSALFDQMAGGESNGES